MQDINAELQRNPGGFMFISQPFDLLRRSWNAIVEVTADYKVNFWIVERG